MSILLSNYGKSYTGGGGSSLGTKLPARMPLSTGATYYVDGTNGNDANSGSSSAAWKTINHALNTVPLSGSIIRVRPGTYNSSGSSYVIQFTRKGDVNNPVTLMADTPGTVTVANSDPTTSTFGMWALNASGLRVQDLTFRILSNSGIGGFDGEVLVENSDRIELYRDTFNQVGVIGITCRGGHLGTGSTSDDMWVIDNTFRPSGTNPFAQVTGLSYLSNQYFGSKGSHWIYSGQWGADGTSVGWNQVNGCNRSVIANNVFVGAAAGRDIEFGPEERNSFVVNNTFYGNQSLQTIGLGDPANDASAAYAGQGVVVYGDTGNTAYSTGNNIITNNIFNKLYGHAASGSGSTEAGNIVQNNLAFGNNNGKDSSGHVWDGDASLDYMYYYGTISSIMFSIGNGNLPSADPLFVGAGTYNYQLQATSPALGKSDPAYTYPYDITGKARPASADLGAYQH
jgi:hypothetical protein